MFAIILGWTSAAWAAAPATLTTLHAVHSLSSAEASQALPVAFEATVTYYRDVGFDLFVQQDSEAVYVYYKQYAGLVPGDRVLVRGKTQDSFNPVVISDSVTLLRHGDPPRPIQADFDRLIRAQLVCMRVTVHAVVHSADLVWSDNGRQIYLQMLIDGGYIDAAVNSEDANSLKGLLDATVEVTGVVGEKFDGKKQQVGIAIWVQTLADVKILKRGGIDPDSLPVTPMDQVLSASHVQDLTQRVRVKGAITYYQPGSAIALQSGAKSLWIMTLTDTPMRVGDLADVTGFPDVRNGFLTLTRSEIRDLQVQAPVVPQPVSWRELGAGTNAFDLVSVEGRLLLEVREASQDEYVLVSDGNLLSAIYRHPNPATVLALPPMEQFPLGAKIRITGISMYYSSDPFNGPLASNILLRSFADITVIAKPPWLSIESLIRVVIALLLVVIAVFAWGWTLRRKVHRQTAALAGRIKAEAELERRRSRILEEINGSRPLAEIIELITDLVSLKLEGALSWCEIKDGARLGNYPPEPHRLRIVSEEISGSSGPPLGVLFAGIRPGTGPPPAADETATLAMGTRLATLAIETLRLHADLVHRSEFDQLTGIHNRFSLDKHLDQLIEQARLNAGIFGLFYIDLDDFKQVNDLYGHRVGDLYLQQVALRMKQQLRSNDMLARQGGDEFALLVPVVRNREATVEIALRLDHCFDDPFVVEGCVLQGSASIGIALYPEDGTTKESMLSAADATMYVAKHTRRQITEIPGLLSKPGITPGNRA